MAATNAENPHAGFPNTFPSASNSSFTSDTDSTSNRGVSIDDGDLGPRTMTKENLDALLRTLPSSPKALLAKIQSQSDQIRLLQQENIKLKAKEVEVSSMTLQLQSYFNATQNQVERLKHEVHTQLLNPIDEDEYQRIEATVEEKRDLLDTIKIGIYRQLGSARASTKAATQRIAELSAEIGRLREENAELKVMKKEFELLHSDGKDGIARKNREIEQQRIRVAELEGVIKDLNGKLKSFYTDQEQFLSAKLTAQVKTDEVARLTVRLEEVSMDLAAAKTSAECSEQKLDILKSEYYELKLKYSQRIQELENAVKTADEKLKLYSDVEMESELFISNLSEHIDGSGKLVLQNSPGSSDSVAAHMESYMALPRSRKLAHSLLVTKRCLHLENKVQMLSKDVDFKEQQIAKLQASLDAARQALNNINSPYLLLEKTVDQVCSERDEMQRRVGILENDVVLLRNRLKQRNEDIRVLCKHRIDLLQMKKLLRLSGLSEELGVEAAAPRAALVPSSQVDEAAVHTVKPLASPKSHLTGQNVSHVEPPNSLSGVSFAQPVEINC